MPLRRSRGSRVVLLALFLAGPQPATAQNLLDFWIPNGPVYATAYDPVRERLYIGGNFDKIGPPSGAGALVHSTTGTILDPLLRIGPLGAVVRSVVSDGSGGWFLGGEFGEIRGTARQNLAHIDASGNVDAWNPGADGPVHSLALSGGVLYAGGAFATLAGVARTRLGAVDPSTGIATAWAPSANDTVRFVGVFSGVVYIGGDFTQVNASTRNRAAALNTSGSVTSWSPDAAGTVRAIYRSGTAIALGGDFLNMGGQVRLRLAVVNTTTGTLAPTTIGANASVYAFESDGTRLFVGGAFTGIGGLSRTGVAAVNLTTLAMDAGWNANLDGAVRDLFLFGTQLHLAGDFESAAGSLRPGAAAVTAASGTLQPWDPRTGSPTHCVGATATNAFVGGGFVVTNFENRNSFSIVNLAVYDFSPTSANFGRLVLLPIGVGGPGSVIRALAFDNPYLYVGGTFSGYLGFSRANAAKSNVDGWGNDGGTQPWAPNTDGEVRSIAATSAGVGLCGVFSTPHASIFEASAASGNPIAFPPFYVAPGTVEVVSIAWDGTMYFGGAINYVVRGVGGFYMGTQMLSPFTPFPTDSTIDPVTIRCLDTGTPQILYAGGTFSNYGMLGRRNLLSFDVSPGGTATDWSPNPDGTVTTLGRNGTRLYAGGNFGSVFGESRVGLASFDLSRGAKMFTWNPTLQGAAPGPNTPYSIAAGPNRVVVGGDFSGANGVFNPYLAVFDDSATTILAVEDGPLARRRMLAVNPNPMHQSGSVTFTLAHASTVSLDVLDVQGRVVVRALSSASMAAGKHRVPLDAVRLRPGVYLARLDAGGHTESVRWARID